MKLLGKFDLSALAILTFSTAADHDGEPDNFADVMQASGCDDFAAPDTDLGSASRDGWTWTCLVRREDVQAWTEAGAAGGYDVETEDARVGHHGDGHWAGADVVYAAGSESAVYWIDMEIPADVAAEQAR